MQKVLMLTHDSDKTHEDKSDERSIAAKDIVNNSEAQVLDLMSLSPEKEFLLDVLNTGIIGQKEANAEFADRFDQGLNRMSFDRGPMGSVFLSGPTGVGKTETVRVLAKAIFGDEEAFIRIDGEELSSSSDKTRIHGASDSFVGFGSEGFFDEVGDHYKTAIADGTLHPLFMRQRDITIILVDECEKAHDDVIQSFLSILEKGYYSAKRKVEGTSNDYKKVTIDMSSVLFVFASNIGQAQAELERDKNPLGFSIASENEVERDARGVVDKAYKKHFSPEFRNRMNGPITYNPIGEESRVPIVLRHLEGLNKSLKQTLKTYTLQITLSDEAINHLVTSGFGEKNGARPLKSIFKREIHSLASRAMIDYERQLEAGENNVIHFDYDEETHGLSLSLYSTQSTETESQKSKTRDEVIGVLDEIHTMTKKTHIDFWDMANLELVNTDLLHAVMNGIVNRSMDRDIGEYYNDTELFDEIGIEDNVITGKVLKAYVENKIKGLRRDHNKLKEPDMFLKVLSGTLEYVTDQRCGNLSLSWDQEKMIYSIVASKFFA